MTNEEAGKHCLEKTVREPCAETNSCLQRGNLEETKIMKKKKNTENMTTLLAMKVKDTLNREADEEELSASKKKY